MNRYSNYSTSQFQPLSLDEIMMIPMAKQANHDKLANDAAMLEQSDFNRLQGDDPISNQELDDYHNKVRKLSEDLYATGYNPHVANKLKELNKEYNQNMSATGKWGRRQSNYNAYNAYKDEIMKNKDWSQADMQKLAYIAGSNFKTDNEDGTFNTFQGKYAPDKVDLNKFLDDSVKAVAAEIDEKWVGKFANLDEFTSLYVNEKIEKKDYDKIIQGVAAQLNANKDIQSMLLFQNELNGSPMTTQEVLTHFDVVIDPETGREQYIPLTDAGRLLSAKAYSAQYTNISKEFIKDDNEKALANYKQSLQNQENDRQRELNGLPILSGEAASVNIFSGFSSPEHVQKQIEDLRKKGGAENIAEAQRLENNINDAKIEFQQRNKDVVEQNTKLRNALLKKGLTESEINSYLSAILGDQKGYAGNVSISLKKTLFHQLPKDQQTLFNSLASNKIKENKYITSDYKIDQNFYTLPPSKDSEQLSMYFFNSLRDQYAAMGANNLKISNAQAIGPDGQIDVIKLTEKEKISLQNQLANPGASGNFVGIIDGQGQVNNKMVVNMKHPTVPGGYIRLEIDSQGMYTSEGNLTYEGSMIKAWADKGDSGTKQTLGAYMMKQKDRNIIPVKNTSDFSGSGFISGDMNPVLYDYSNQYNLQDISTNDENMYQIGIKNYKGETSYMTYEKLRELGKNTEEIQSLQLMHVAKKRYPDADLNTAIQNTVKDIKEQRIDMDSKEYLKLPVITSTKSQMLHLIQ